eukprot:1159501-Pelagomonas_calceolata.AAC.8
MPSHCVPWAWGQTVSQAGCLLLSYQKFLSKSLPTATQATQAWQPAWGVCWVGQGCQAKTLQEGGSPRVSCPMAVGLPKTVMGMTARYRGFQNKLGCVPS